MATIHDPSALTSTATQYLLAKYYDKVLLERLIPELRWMQGADKKRLPQRGGKIIKFSAFKNLAVGTRLTESTKPTPLVLSTFNITATLGQWGAYGAVSDLLEVTSITSVIQEAIEVFGEQSALTIDSEIRSVAWGGGLPSAASRLSASGRMRNTGSVSALSAFHNLYFGYKVRMTRQCSGATMAHLSTADLYNASAFNANTKATMRDIRESVSVLRTNNAKPRSDGFYFGIGHPAGLADLRSDSEAGSWIEWMKYTSPEKGMFKGEIGQAEGVRFVQSTNAIDKPLNTGAVISASVITLLGRGALGVVDFENFLDGKMKNHVIVKKANQYNTDDPLNQVAGTVGWKVTFAGAILNVSSGLHLMALRN